MAIVTKLYKTEAAVLTSSIPSDHDEIAQASIGITWAAAASEHRCMAFTLTEPSGTGTGVAKDIYLYGYTESRWFYIETLSSVDLSHDHVVVPVSDHVVSFERLYCAADSAVKDFSYFMMFDPVLKQM